MTRHATGRCGRPEAHRSHEWVGRSARRSPGYHGVTFTCPGNEPTTDHIDVQRRPGIVERRPVPARPVGTPISHDDRGRPIYQPPWADYTWFAVWMSARSVWVHAARRRMRFVHMRLCSNALGGHAAHEATREELTDWRDTLATLRDLWAWLDAEEAAA